jgi:uncharacterized protein YjiS (DUF1127 family)
MKSLTILSKIPLRREASIHGNDQHVAGLRQFIRDAVIEPVRRRLRRRASERALIDLDDRTLRDIGLMRSDAHAVARGLLSMDALTCGPTDARSEARRPDSRKASGRRPAGNASHACLRSALLAAAVLCSCLAVAARADDGRFDDLPTIKDLPAGTIQVSPPIPGMGEHWARPEDLPLGPIYCVMDGRVICAEFMVAREDLLAGKSFEFLRLGIENWLPPVDHLELNSMPHGHEGYEAPHYDVHMYFVPPEARFPERAAGQ